jgi:hypothetical protein
MSNLTTQVFGDMNYLYEHIANRDAQQLNENSDHYDKEFAELVEDIISTISLSMVHEGYSANGIVSFLANSPNEDIIEKYLNFDENILTESTVSEDYIQEQLDQLNEFVGAALRVLGAGLKAAKYAKGVKGLAPVARLSSGLKGAGTAAERVAKQGLKQSSVIRSGLSKGVDKVKDIAKGAKTALTGSTAKKVGLGAAALGAATGAGYIGGRMSGSGSQRPVPSLAKPPTTQKPPAAPKLPSPSSNSGGGSGSGAPSRSGGGSSNTPKKPAFTKQTGNPEKDMKTWAASNPKLAAAKAERDRIRGTQQSDNPQFMKDMPGTRPLNSPSVQSPDVAKLGAGNQSLTNNPNAFKAATPPTPKASDKKSEKNEAYDAYELVLEYLFDYGHADTIEEAEYIMTELDESFIQSLVETYEANVLAEEVTEWVNELVEEGYDLSEYSWDDMVDHYFTEEFKDTGYHDNYDPYSSGNGNQSRATSSRGRRIQKRVRELEASGDNEKANSIHKIASNRKNQEHGLAKQKRNKSRGPGPRRAKEDAMRDMRNSGF